MNVYGVDYGVDLTLTRKHDVHNMCSSLHLMHIM